MYYQLAVRSSFRERRVAGTGENRYCLAKWWLFHKKSCGDGIRLLGKANSLIASTRETKKICKSTN